MLLQVIIQVQVQVVQEVQVEMLLQFLVLILNLFMVPQTEFIQEVQEVRVEFQEHHPLQEELEVEAEEQHQVCLQEQALLTPVVVAVEVMVLVVDLKMVDQV